MFERQERWSPDVYRLTREAVKVKSNPISIKQIIQKKKENLTEVHTNSSVYEHKRVCRCFFFLTKETLEFAQDKMETTEKRKTVQRTGEETSKMKTGRSGIVWLLLIPVEV